MLHMPVLAATVFIWTGIKIYVTSVTYMVIIVILVISAVQNAVTSRGVLVLWAIEPHRPETIQFITSSSWLFYLINFLVSMQQYRLISSHLSVTAMRAD